MSKQKAIIFDIDGTVVDSPEQKLPTDGMTQAFKRVQQDYKLCAATGRGWSFAKDILQALNLSEPCILSGGTQIIQPQDGTVLWEVTMPAEAQQQILEIAKNNRHINVVYNDYPESDYLKGGFPVDDVRVDEDFYLFNFVFVPSEEAKSLCERLENVDGITCTMVVSQRPGCNDLHVTHEFATKEHAIAELLKLIQVDVDQTIGIGDGHNDLQLFRGVKTKIAMGNAVPELKAAADQVIGDVTSDGLAVYLEALVGKSHA